MPKNRNLAKISMRRPREAPKSACSTRGTNNNTDDYADNIEYPRYQKKVIENNKHGCCSSALETGVTFDFVPNSQSSGQGKQYNNTNKKRDDG